MNSDRIWKDSDENRENMEPMEPFKTKNVKIPGTRLESHATNAV